MVQKSGINSPVEVGKLVNFPFYTSQVVLFLRFHIHQANQSPHNERPQNQQTKTSNSKNHPVGTRGLILFWTELCLSKQRIGDSVCIISISCGEFDDETNGRKNRGKAGWKRLTLQVLKYTLTELTFWTQTMEVCMEDEQILSQFGWLLRFPAVLFFVTHFVNGVGLLVASVFSLNFLFNKQKQGKKVNRWQYFQGSIGLHTSVQIY